MPTDVPTHISYVVWEPCVASISPQTEICNLPPPFLRLYGNRGYSTRSFAALVIVVKNLCARGAGIELEVSK